MGTKANPTVVGAFIVGALVLIAGAVLVFGGNSWFTVKDTFVMYFGTSVNGLNVGAPVKFRGVEIGEVKEVRALYNTLDDTTHIQVVIETEAKRFDVVTDGVITPSSATTPEDAQRLIALGLRGQLQVQSMVTGLLFIDFDFYRGTEAPLLGLDPRYQELPVIPTTMEQLFTTVSQAMDKLGKLEVEQFLTHIQVLLERVTALLTSSGTERALQSLGSILEGADQGLATFLPRLAQVMDQLSETTAAAHAVFGTAERTLVGVQQLTQHLDRQVDPLLGPATAALVTARGTLQQARKTLKTLEGAATPPLKQAEKAFAAAASLTGSDSRVMTDLSRSLEALEDAARSIRILAESLQRNPESLLRGKIQNRGR